LKLGLGTQFLLQITMFNSIRYACDCAEIVGSGGDSEQAVTQSEDMGGIAADSDWHALSKKEEVDLDTIMSQCDFAISNAEKFADQLSRDLSVLDGVCHCSRFLFHNLSVVGLGRCNALSPTRLFTVRSLTSYVTYVGFYS